MLSQQNVFILLPQQNVFILLPQQNVFILLPQDISGPWSRCSFASSANSLSLIVVNWPVWCGCCVQWHQYVSGNNISMCPVTTSVCVQRHQYVSSDNISMCPVTSVCVQLQHKYVSSDNISMCPVTTSVCVQWQHKYVSSDISMCPVTTSVCVQWQHQYKARHEISGLNPVARSESLAAIFSRTDLIQKKKRKIYHRRIAKLKYLVANGDLATRNFAPWYKVSIKSIGWFETYDKDTATNTENMTTARALPFDSV
jgi:hypothetical protein